MIQAARRIFAKDGFEHARIEDIATLARRTRGAFYANFQNKEDVFFAIFEEYVERDQAVLRSMLAGKMEMVERWDVVSGYLVELAQDRQRTLLMLEFKMYAIRHPQRRKRLAELHAEMRERCAMPEIEEVLPHPERQTAEERRRGILALTAVMDGLALNHLFNPEDLSQNLIAEYVSLCIDAGFRKRPGVHG